MTVIIRVEQEYNVVRTVYVKVDADDPQTALEAINSGEVELPEFTSSMWVDSWRLIDERSASQEW